MANWKNIVFENKTAAPPSHGSINNGDPFIVEDIGSGGTGSAENLIDRAGNPQAFWVKPSSDVATAEPTPPVVAGEETISYGGESFTLGNVGGGGTGRWDTTIRNNTDSSTTAVASDYGGPIFYETSNDPGLAFRAALGGSPDLAGSADQSTQFRWNRSTHTSGVWNNTDPNNPLILVADTSKINYRMASGAPSPRPIFGYTYQETGFKMKSKRDVINEYLAGGNFVTTTQASGGAVKFEGPGGSDVTVSTNYLDAPISSMTSAQGGWTVTGDEAQVSNDNIFNLNDGGNALSINNSGNGTGLEIHSVEPSLINLSYMVFGRLWAAGWFGAYGTGGEGQVAGIDCWNAAAVEAGRLYIPLGNIIETGTDWTDGDYVTLYKPAQAILYTAQHYTGFEEGQTENASGAVQIDLNNGSFTLDDTISGTVGVGHYFMPHTHNWNSNGPALLCGARLFRYNADPAGNGSPDTATGPRLECLASDGVTMNTSGSNWDLSLSDPTSGNILAYQSGQTLTGSDALGIMMEAFNNYNTYEGAGPANEGIEFHTSAAGVPVDRGLVLKFEDPNDTSTYYFETTKSTAPAGHKAIVRTVGKDSGIATGIGGIFVNAGKPVINLPSNSVATP